MDTLKINITRSYSRKLVPENHDVNGYRFAPFDFFMAYGEELLAKEATPEKVKELSEKLHKQAHDDVERAYSNKLNELRSLKEVGLNTEELTGISTHIQMINAGASSNELKVVIEKDKLNDKQVDFLRKYFMIANSNG